MVNKLSSIKKNLFANFFGIAVQLFTQIALVPLFLIYWDVDKYGDWILITAITSFFAMADVGLSSVTINQFVIKHAEGDLKTCRSLLTNNYILIFFVFILSILGAVILLLNIDVTATLGLHIISREIANILILLLIFHVFLGMFGNILDAIYRAHSFNHISVYIGNIVRLLEGIILVVGLVFNFNLISIATLYLLPRLLSLLYKVFNSKKIYLYRFSFSDVNWTLFKSAITPSLTFLAFPLGNAIIFQGLSIIVNRYFGTQALVLYNTTRTLTNFVTQILGAFLQAIWPDFSIAFGHKNYRRMRKLHRKAFVISCSLAILMSLFIVLFGRIIYTIWTQGRVTFDLHLLIAFLVVLIARNIWSTSSVILMATNKHSSIGVFYVIFASISMLLSAFFAAQFNSLILVVYSILLMELVLSFFAINKALAITKDNWQQFIFSFRHMYRYYRSMVKSSLKFY